MAGIDFSQRPRRHAARRKSMTDRSWRGEHVRWLRVGDAINQWMRTAGGMADRLGRSTRPSDASSPDANDPTNFPIVPYRRGDL